MPWLGEIRMTTKKIRYILMPNIMWDPAPFATSYMVGREDKRTNNTTMRGDKKKTHGAAGYKGPMNIELLESAGVLIIVPLFKSNGMRKK